MGKYFNVILMKKKIIITVVALVIIGVIVVVTNFGFFMDLGMKMTSSMQHRDISKEQAAFTLSSDELSKSFTANKDEANKKYINKSVLVEGAVSAVEGVTVSLDHVACNMDSTQITMLKDFKPGSKVKIQGLVVGYDDLMDEIKLSQCVIK